MSIEWDDVALPELMSPFVRDWRLSYRLRTISWHYFIFSAGEVTIPAPVQLPLSASPTIENSQRVAEERESKRYQKSYSLSPTQAHSEPGCSMAIDMATKSSVEKPDVRRKHKHRRYSLDPHQRARPEKVKGLLYWSPSERSNNCPLSGAG